jgi:hypothetical protein
MSMAALLRTIQVVDCKDFPEGGMWEHGGFAEDYPGRGAQQHSRRLPGRWRNDFPKGSRYRNTMASSMAPSGRMTALLRNVQVRERKNSPESNI